MTFWGKCQSSLKRMLMAFAMFVFVGAPAFAGEANLVVPKIEGENHDLLMIGIVVSVLGVLWGLLAFSQVKALKTLSQTKFIIFLFHNFFLHL